MDEQKKYGIFRIEKVKLCDGGETMGRLKHAFREFDNDSFDPELTKNNESFLLHTAKEVMKAYKNRIKEITTDKYKPPKNSVGIYECIFTSTAGAIPKEREDEFFKRTYNQLCELFGKDNVLAGAVHRDETTVHTHWFITPIYNTTSVLRRTKEEKKNGTCRTTTLPKLNATHWTGSPTLMSELQDKMWEGIFQHFGLERGEVELTADRTKKKKNVRADIKKRDLTLARKEEALEREAEKQKIEEESLIQQAEEQLKRDEALLNEKAAFQKMKVDFEDEMETASQKAIEKYDEYIKSEKFNAADFPSLPVPEYKEGAFRYHLRIKPLFNAIVSKAKEFWGQIKSVEKRHRTEIEKLKDEHEFDLEKVKARAETEKQAAIQKAVLAKTAENNATVNSLKQEIEKEKCEKEKWHAMLFKKFTIKIGDRPVEINQGLRDAYLEKSKQLAEWENRNGDELISLGTNYKKLHVKNWGEYVVRKVRPKVIDHGISR